MGSARGEIHFRARAKQLINFNRLIYGSITPTDIDGYIDFQNKCAVFIELKYKDAELPYGQRLALERLVINLKIPAICIVGTHNMPPEKDIDASICLVREYFSSGKWHMPKSEYSVKRLIDEFTNKYAPWQGLRHARGEEL